LRSDGTRDLHDHDFVDTWKDLEKLLSTGKVKAIGVSNFDIHNLEILLQNSTVVPAVNQVELHAYLQQKDLKQYCSQKGIHVTAYSP
jgi:glycerol 2-dehydrogenase (NADP+)